MDAVISYTSFCFFWCQNDVKFLSPNRGLSDPANLSKDSLGAWQVYLVSVVDCRACMYIYVPVWIQICLTF